MFWGVILLCEFKPLLYRVIKSWKWVVGKKKQKKIPRLIRVVGSTL